MLKFAFILTMFAPDGSADLFVMDSNLTGEDCIAAVENYMTTTPDMRLGRPSCELDMATTFIVMHEGKELTLPACTTEDSVNCVWDGQQHGNGKGQSFYTVDGQTVYLD